MSVGPEYSVHPVGSSGFTETLMVERKKWGWEVKYGKWKSLAYLYKLLVLDCWPGSTILLPGEHMSQNPLPECFQSRREADMLVFVL